MNNFAIIRHGKIKAGRHLVATGLHNGRRGGAENADQTAPGGIEIIHGSSEPHRDVMAKLETLGIKKVRKDGNVAIEVMLAASPDWWETHGWKRGEVIKPETRQVIDQWRDANVKYLEDRFGAHLLASVQLHLDEASPHIQALMIPAQYRKDGRSKDRGLAWRLSAEKVLPGPRAMKQIVSEYAKEMEPFGLVRGADLETGRVQHRPLREWQDEQAKIKKELHEMKELQEAERRKELEDAAREREALRVERMRLEIANELVEDERKEIARERIILRKKLRVANAMLKEVKTLLNKLSQAWRKAAGFNAKSLGLKGPNDGADEDYARLVGVYKAMKDR